MTHFARSPTVTDGAHLWILASKRLATVPHKPMLSTKQTEQLRPGFGIK